MECKVVLVGDSKCGKSALIHRFANDNFLRVSENQWYFLQAFI